MDVSCFEQGLLFKCLYNFVPRKSLASPVISFLSFLLLLLSSPHHHLVFKGLQFSFDDLSHSLNSYERNAEFPRIEEQGFWPDPPTSIKI